MSDLRDRVDDWMVRITFAEHGKAKEGFEETGEKLDKKIRIALDKLIVVRSERAVPEGEPADASAAPAAPEEPAREEGGALQVLLVDDEPIVGKRLGPALRKYGIEVEYYRDPLEAVERLAGKRFDVVITDMKMEEMNGLQVLERVMATSPSTRVIMITGYGSVEVAREALTKGAFDFISKPFKPSDLRAVVNKAALSLGFKPLED